MFIFSGTVTQEATIREAGKRSVVSFHVADNENYSVNGEKKQKTTFVECSFWGGTAVSKHLIPGTFVQMTGHIEGDAYLKAGKAVGVVKFKVKDFLEIRKPKGIAAANAALQTAGGLEEGEENPF